MWQTQYTYEDGRTTQRPRTGSTAQEFDSSSCKKCGYELVRLFGGLGHLQLRVQSPPTPILVPPHEGGDAGHPQGGVRPEGVALILPDLPLTHLPS